MKISLNQLRYYRDKYDWAGEPAPEGVEALVQKIGARLGAVEEVVDFGSRYEGVVIAKIAKVEDHPKADRLHVCKIDDGGKTPGVTRDEQGLVQVVCGAPNVHEGMLAAWLPPGSTVPESAGKELLVLEARELRGVVSNGMLASARELGLGTDHDGILEITLDSDEQITPGTSFAAAYHLTGDVVIDIENKMFTHRPDCFGLIGVAREVAGIQGQAFTSPDWYRPDAPFPDKEADELALEVRNELPELVPRFTAVTMRDVKVGPSPLWLQIDLARAGLRPINNIVDYTNYFMLLTGQPIHAYDYDKVREFSGGNRAELVIRHPAPGEKITLLNGKELAPRSEAMMVAAGDRLICVGGVMGGSETEVSDQTTNIIIEAANWDMYELRRTAMEHGVFTDAVTRFTKGQSPLQNRAVVAKIVDEIRRFAGGKVAGPLIDDMHLDEAILQRNSVHPSVSVTAEFINARLGLQLLAEEMAAILKNVEFKVETANGQLVVAAPFWRTDIEIPEDIVEEVGRLYGYDKLPLELPKHDLAPPPKNSLLASKAKIRSILAKAGANEVLTYSFVHGNLLDKVGQDSQQAFQLSNALSPDLQYYRLSLIPSLLEKIHPNIKAGYDEFALFELGKVHAVPHLDVQGLPAEFDRVALVMAAQPKVARYQNSGAPYYQARKYVATVLSAFSVDLQFAPLSEAEFEGHAALQQMVQPYEPNRSAVVRNSQRIVGVVGEFRPSVRKALKLPPFSAGFELFLAALDGTQNTNQYVPLPRFPKVEQDICLKVLAATNYQQVFDVVWAALQGQEPETTLCTLSPVDIYQRPDDPQYKQITLRLTIASYVRTLTDDEVAKLLDHVASVAKEQLQAERV